MTEKKPKNIASILAEGKEAPIGEINKSLARLVELVVKNYPEIAEKIKAKDVSFEEIVSDLEKVIEVHVTSKGVKVYVEASRTGRES